MNAVAVLNASYSNLRKNEGSPPPVFKGGNWWYYDVTLKETSGNVGVTINSRQKCYRLGGCDPIKTNIAEDYGTNHIPPSEQISDPANYWFTSYSSESMTETFWGVDDNGNPVTASYTIDK